MKVNNSNFYLDYLDGLVDKYDNINRRSIRKKPVDSSCSALPDDIE